MATHTPIDANSLSPLRGPTQPAPTTRIPNEPSLISEHLPLRPRSPLAGPPSCAHANLPNEPNKSLIYSNIHFYDEPNEPNEPKPPTPTQHPRPLSPNLSVILHLPAGLSPRTFFLCLVAVARHAATTVYQASAWFWSWPATPLSAPSNWPPGAVAPSHPRM